MKRLSLDSILLFALVTPFIMNERIGPHDTPYLLFGSIFLVLLTYIITDLISIKKQIYTKIKLILLCVTIVLVLGSAFSSAIVVRHRVAPIYKVHDIVLQQEAAIRHLLDGKNPYTEDYFGTPLEEWHYSDTEINPALYHFVMQPMYLYFALPFYILSNSVIGYFDARMPLYFLVGVSIVLAYLIPKKQENKRIFAILMAFNPAMLAYTLEGRSDMFMFGFLLSGLYLLQRKRYHVAGLLLACAFAIKQSVWPLFPFYAIYLYRTCDVKKIQERILCTAKRLGVFAGIFAILVAPFVVWDLNGFFESTVLYLSGSLGTSYPISGYGWGMILHERGIIPDRSAYYAFSFWQALVGIPLFLVLARYLYRKPRVYRMIICYGIFLFIYWFFSRYFNNSHVGYLTLVFITAYFWHKDV